MALTDLSQEHREEEEGTGLWAWTLETPSTSQSHRLGRDSGFRHVSPSPPSMGSDIFINVFFFIVHEFIFVLGTCQHSASLTERGEH